ncbi:hypothetical protein NDU88_010297 [Pleurodeles waltl]|uniref:Uncharacterized protein n=1 Tax=Pleurodeles waltl TaxID=8319 RepID=A0AAV7S0T3_PLEWA|nr:hypothetical protein NDU88_010297 [Pleurodeles waltl]
MAENCRQDQHRGTASKNKGRHQEEVERPMEEGQCPLKEGNMACHRQERADPWGLWQAEHPLSETVGGPETLGTKDRGGPTGDGLPTM